MAEHPSSLPRTPAAVCTHKPRRLSVTSLHDWLADFANCSVQILCERTLRFTSVFLIEIGTHTQFNIFACCHLSKLMTHSYCLSADHFSNLNLSQTWFYQSGTKWDRPTSKPINLSVPPGVISIRAGNEPSRTLKLHNYGEGPWGIDCF